MSNRLRLRQKFYQRKSFIIASAFLTSLAIALTVIFHLSRVDKSMAAMREVIIEEQQFTAEKTLDAPFIKTTEAVTGPVQLARRVKEISSTDPDSNRDSNSK